MKGHLLEFNVQTNTGAISGQDGNRYTFAGNEWKGDTAPIRGTLVDFDVQGNNAVSIYKALNTGSVMSPKSPKEKLVAGLLAILLGGLGIHKFYLGYTGPALVYLLTNTIGWCITIFLFGVPNIILGIIALIEGIIYLTKSDEEFQRIYVDGKRSWF